MYEVINEKLGIKACGIADLTEEQTSNFMEQWGEGVRINTLSLFYEKESGDLVLNKDNQFFKQFKDIAEEYLSASGRAREEFREVCQISSLERMLDVLDYCCLHRIGKKKTIHTA